MKVSFPFKWMSVVTRKRVRIYMKNHPYPNKGLSPTIFINDGSFFDFSKNSIFLIFNLVIRNKSEEHD
ncbi:hypothetical protein CW311_06230 [Acinetobacter proteolyticus]|uniref:Uncharacterized protein n=1 Tax=Acinetobacter proteolyticus TaxID=1776741 RepID=A0A2N0WH62_9GAMM|nr:hypothetical protein CW311_06230 [Acinetobacter proteolyticus]